MRFDKYSPRVETISNSDTPGICLIYYNKGIGSYNSKKPISTHKYQFSKTGRNSQH